MTLSKYYQELQTFPQRLKKLSQKYKDKKIVLYGCGEFFVYIKNNYDLSVLNIIAISDKKYTGNQTPVYDQNIGYNVITPEFIYTLKPDIVLISAQQDMYIEKYFCEELFAQTHKKFKYSTLTKLPLSEKIKRCWAYD